MSEMTPHDLIEAYEGRAGLLARAILYGLTEPSGEMSPAINMTVSEVIVTQLALSNTVQFFRRLPYALKWAIRPETPPEMGILTVQRVFARCSKTRLRNIKRLPEYKDFIAKLGEFIPDVVT
jgi:hypothetical protein